MVQKMAVVMLKSQDLSINDVKAIGQCFPNFSCARTTSNLCVVREAQNIDLYRDLRTTSANIADHLWSAEQTLRITGDGIKDLVFLWLTLTV